MPKVMEIVNLKLVNFRSYTKREFIFEKPLIVISGPNGAGKTNVMESIYLLALGKSFRAEMEEEMIRMGEVAGTTLAEIKTAEEKTSLEVVLVGGNEFNVRRKKFLVNGIPRRMVDFVGQFRAVLFGPWDLDLITDSPSIRRRYLDSVLIQIDREYRRSLLSYEKGLRQRNKLLERIREGTSSRSQLVFWDKLLIRNGDYLSRKREEFLSFLNLYQPLSGSRLGFSCSYEQSSISESRLVQYAEEEVAAAVTLVGPHRDDVTFYFGESEFKKDLSKYGSRGEQRLAVLWMKLGELEFLAQDGERPVLLLDDIFSELDHAHRDLVTSVIGNQQTFLTTADEHFISQASDQAQIIRL